MLNRLIGGLTICAICAGCVNSPFINESIAKLNANPVPSISRFGLPSAPPLPIAVQSADMLEGAWETGIMHPCHRSVGHDGTITDFDKTNA